MGRGRCPVATGGKDLASRSESRCIAGNYALRHFQRSLAVPYPCFEPRSVAQDLRGEFHLDESTAVPRVQPRNGDRRELESVFCLGDTAGCTCGCDPDLDRGGRLPAFSRWAELSGLGSEEDLRNKGIGAWVGRHAVQWLVMAGKTPCVLCVAMDDGKNGAGRFYRRFGWSPVVRLKRGWTRTISS